MCCAGRRQIYPWQLLDDGVLGGAQLCLRWQAGRVEPLAACGDFALHGAVAARVAAAGSSGAPYTTYGAVGGGSDGRRCAGAAASLVGWLLAVFYVFGWLLADL